MKPLLRQFTVESNDAEPPRRALHRIILLFVAAFAIGGVSMQSMIIWHNRKRCVSVQPAPK